MTKRIGRRWFLVTLLALPVVGDAASFDCAKASTPVEKLICSNDELSKLDEALATAYQTAKAASGASVQLTRDQRAWLARRDGCRDHPCIKAAYDTRLKELGKVLDAKSPGTAAGSDNSHAEFCAALVEPERPKIQFLKPRFLIADESSLIIKKLRENNKDLYFDYIEAKYRIDVDNDGILENVVITAEGSAKTQNLLVYDDTWNVKNYKSIGFDFDDDHVRWAEPKSIVRFKSRTYAIASDSTGEFMRYASVYETGVHRMLCKIGYENIPKETIAHATDMGLCRAVLGGKITYPPFEHTSGLRDDGCFESGGPACARPGGAALVDIDNDGKRDRVVQMGVAWGGGRGCDFEFLAIPNAAANDLVRTGTGKLLIEATTKWGVCGGATSEPFRYRGTWYVDNKYRQDRVFGYHNVVSIRDGKVHKICEFAVRKRPYLM